MFAVTFHFSQVSQGQVQAVSGEAEVEAANVYWDFVNIIAGELAPDTWLIGDAIQTVLATIIGVFVIPLFILLLLVVLLIKRRRSKPRERIIIVRK